MLNNGCHRLPHLSRSADRQPKRPGIMLGSLASICLHTHIVAVDRDGRLSRPTLSPSLSQGSEFGLKLAWTKCCSLKGCLKRTEGMLDPDPASTPTVQFLHGLHLETTTTILLRTPYGCT